MADKALLDAKQACLAAAAAAAGAAEAAPVEVGSTLQGLSMAEAFQHLQGKSQKMLERSNMLEMWQFPGRLTLVPPGRHLIPCHLD